jgi:glycosyltransferase involved in cell wall biosynthesis
VLWVNNSNETFTPTVSGAIATCLWELLLASADEVQAEVITPDVAADVTAEPYAWPRVTRVRPTALRLTGAGAYGARADRAVRRLTGWAHPRQADYARQVLAHARATGPELIVCNNDPEVAVALGRALPGTRVLHWFHNLELAADPWRRRLAAGSNVVPVAVSGYLARAVEQVYRLGPGAVAVARNGVDATRFTPGPPPERATVAFLGRVAVEKGTDTFLEALLLLAARGETPDVLIIGDTNWGFGDGGAFGQRISRLVADVEAAGVTVRRTGHLPRAEVPDALHGADVQVLGSRWDEPCALTVLEGMAAGLAMVVTATGGTPELVGAAGLLVPREDPAAMADALAGLLRDPERRRRHGAAARERAETFTWHRTWTALREAAA